MILRQLFPTTLNQTTSSSSSSLTPSSSPNSSSTIETIDINLNPITISLENIRYSQLLEVKPTYDYDLPEFYITYNRNIFYLVNDDYKEFVFIKWKNNKELIVGLTEELKLKLIEFFVN